MQCLSCGNSKRFITERRIWCWVDVDGEGAFIGNANLQGEYSDRPGAHEEVPHAHIECFECHGTDIEIGE